MKKVVLLVILLIIASINGFAQNQFFENLELNRISSNFKGSVSNGNSILVFGDGGIILRTTTGGLNWEKVSLNDSLTIIGIVQNGSKYFGLTSSRWGITSIDNGKNWNLIDLGYTNFYQLLNYKDNLIALTETKILIFNSSMIKIKEYSYNSDTTYYNATIIDNKIAISSGHGKLTFIDIDNGKIQTNILSDYGGCSTCPVVKNLNADGKNQLYFTLNSKLFRLNLLTKSLDTLVNLRKINGAPFTIYQDELFYLYSLQTLSALDSLYFNKIDITSKSYNKINKNESDRYISGLAFQSIYFINKDTIIAVGKNNLIYMSFNSGINWELKSWLGNYFYIDIFSNGEARAIGNYSQFFNSTNNGVTWLPSKNYYDIFYDNYRFGNPINNYGCGFFKDKNNGFLNISIENSSDIGTVFTNDGGNTLKPINKKDFYPDFNSFAIENNNKYMFFQWGCLGWNLGCWTVVFTLNDTLGIETKTSMRSTQMFYATKFKDKIYAIAKDSSEANNSYTIYFTNNFDSKWTKGFTFNIDEPNSLYCNNANQIDNSIYATWSKKIISKNDTSIFQTCYQIDLVNKISKKIIEVRGDNSSRLFKINDSYYLVSYYYDNIKGYLFQMYTTNDISTNNINWKQIDFKRYKVPAINNLISDSIIAFTTYDSLTRSNALYFGTAKKLTSTVDDLNIANNDPIYITNPKPQPAKDKVQFNIYWDQKYDVDRSNFVVYNLLGELISNKNDFLFNKFNNYSGELTWFPKSNKNGIYFVTFMIGSSFTTSIVIIE